MWLNAAETKHKVKHYQYSFSAVSAARIPIKVPFFTEFQTVYTGNYAGSKFHENCNFSVTEKFSAASFERLLVPPTHPFSKKSNSERFFRFRSRNYSCEAENWHTSSLLCKKNLYQISAKSDPITTTFEKNHLAVWVIIFFEFLRNKNYYIFGESSPWQRLSKIWTHKMSKSARYGQKKFENRNFQSNFSRKH